MLAAFASLLGASAAFAAPHWSGFYIGALMGYDHQDADFVLDPAGTNFGAPGFNAARLGGTVGFNFLSGGGMLFGVEADLVTHLGQRVETPIACCSAAQSSDFMASLRARAGIISEDVLFYVTAGYGWDQITLQPAPIYGVGPLADDTVGGIVLGAGFETFISDHWSVQVQYTHAEYDDTASLISLFGPGHLKDPSSDAVDISFRWHFGQD